MVWLLMSMLRPPAISTLPLGSSVVVAWIRASFMRGVEAENVLATGSYSSVLLRIANEQQPTDPSPPAISTLPLGKSVPVARALLAFIRGVVVAKVSVTGSYSSVVARLLLTPRPPAISTLPLGNSVAVAYSRGSFIKGSVAVRVLIDGDAAAASAVSIVAASPA